MSLITPRRWVGYVPYPCSHVYMQMRLQGPVCAKCGARKQ